MKTKLFAVLLAVLMALGLTACHKTEDVEVTTTAPVNLVEETTLEEETTEAEKTTAKETTKKAETSLAGSWQDRVSQRATMDISGGKNNVYTINVHWGSTAYEAVHWTMTGTYDPDKGVLTYSNAKKSTIDSSGDTDTETVEYTNGTGKFVYKNGELSWQADNDPDTSICVFTK